MKTLTLTFLTLLSTYSLAMECTATRRYMAARGIEESSTKFKAYPNIENKYTAELEEAYYTLTDRLDGSYVAKIQIGPNYELGLSGFTSFYKQKQVDEDGNEYFIEQLEQYLVLPKATYFIKCVK